MSKRSWTTLLCGAAILLLEGACLPKPLSVASGSFADAVGSTLAGTESNCEFEFEVDVSSDVDSGLTDIDFEIDRVAFEMVIPSSDVWEAIEVQVQSPAMAASGAWITVLDATVVPIDADTLHWSRVYTSVDGTDLTGEHDPGAIWRLRILDVDGDDCELVEEPTIDVDGTWEGEYS